MRVIGLISGTSHDGIDVAAVDFTLDGVTLRAQIHYTASVPYDEPLRARLRRSLPPAATTFAEVCALDTLIGQAFADAALAAGPADLICSHGQTVYHWIDNAKALGTLQLGQPAWIASRTGIPVVANLRAADVAAGGQGAPLVAHLDTLLLTGAAAAPSAAPLDTAPVGRFGIGGVMGKAAALNLGGIANITVCGDAPIAYDTGPANALIDAAVYRLTDGRQSYDEGGRLASAEPVDESLLGYLLAEPYYALDPPKTTGKELFNDAYIADLPLPGLIATLTALTAETVAAQVLRHDIDTLVVSGGGCHNPALIAMLRERLPGVTLLPAEALGIPGDAKEAIAFALLGWMTAHSLPGNVPSCTGATRPVILGSLTPGQAPLRVAPIQTTPTSLLVV
jgi:anhydro-N-acetylmuramic acid kinase